MAQDLAKLQLGKLAKLPFELLTRKIELLDVSLQGLRRQHIVSLVKQWPVLHYQVPGRIREEAPELYGNPIFGQSLDTAELRSRPGDVSKVATPMPSAR